MKEKQYQETLALLNKPLCLIGLMGCGKSAIGKRLAKALGLLFYDTDRVIEEREKMTVSAIFAAKGEPYFREVEHQVLTDLLQAHKQAVIATGGGCFIEARNRALILAATHCIWIEADYELLFERVSRKTNRPVLERGDKGAILKQLMEARYPIYREAPIHVQSKDQPHEKMVADVLTKLRVELLP